MSLGFMSGFMTGLGKGLDEFNKTEERNRQREIQIAQADKAAKQKHDQNEMAWAEKFKASADKIIKKQEELKSANSKLSKAERKKAYDNTVEMLNSLISNSGSIAGQKGYTSFANIAEPYMAGGATDKIIDHNGWGIDAKTKVGIDNGDIKIAKDGQIMTPRMTTNSQGALVEELDDQGNTIFEPSGGKVNKIDDIFVSPTTKFETFKAYARNKAGKVVATYDVKSNAHYSAIKEEANRSGYSLKLGSGKDIDSEQYSGYTTTGGVIYYNTKEEFNEAVSNQEVSAEPRANNYMSSQSMLNDKNLGLEDYYKDKFGTGVGYNYKDGAKMHFILSKTTHLSTDQIKDLMSRITDAGWFGKGADFSKIEDSDHFSTEEKIHLRQSLSYLSGENVIVTISETTKQGNQRLENRLMPREKAIALKEKFADNKNAGIEWEDMTPSEVDPTSKPDIDDPETDLTKIINMNPQDKKHYFQQYTKYRNELKRAVGKEGRDAVTKRWMKERQILKQAYGVR